MAITNPRPTEPTLSVAREHVEGTCAACGAHQLRAYPVLSEAGWFDVVKCAACLTDARRVPGPKLGPIELLADRI